MEAGYFADASWTVICMHVFCFVGVIGLCRQILPIFRNDELPLPHGLSFNMSALKGGLDSPWIKNI